MMKTDLLSYYSDQLDNVVANPPVNNPAYSDSGKERIKYFSITVPTGDIAQNGVVGLAIIPADCRIIGGGLKIDAFGGSTMDVGIMGADGSGYYNADEDAADDVDFFLDGIDATATAGDSIAEHANNDLNAGYLTTKEVVVTAKAIGGVFTAAKVMTGFIKYVQN